MNLNDMLRGKNINPQHVLVLRHSPPEPKFKKVLPWLAVEKPDVFNAYQQTQSEKLERAMQKLVGIGYVASFIGHEARKALFVGLYTINAATPITYDELWQIPAHIELKKFDLQGYTKESLRDNTLWFDLVPMIDFYADWKGKLTINWPPPELSWWRWADRNEISINAIHEESGFEAVRQKWNEMVFTWDELSVLPKSWRSALSEWRGIYYIFDTTASKGYVGSAYGKDNLLGRWLSYSTSGHGGNMPLRQRDPRNFRFTILQRVSPDMEQTEIIQLENSWKQRLHTREYGLNEN